MALANFYARAFQAFNQVAYITNPEALQDKLGKTKILIIYDDNSLKMPNTDLILRTAVNLISRLYPFVDIIYTGASSLGTNIREQLVRYSKSINPDIETNPIEDTLVKEIALIIGNVPFEADLKVCINADSWNIEVAINDSCNMIKGKTYNPFAAIASACFGISEVFKIAFLDTYDNDQHYVFSLFDYKKHVTPLEEFPKVNFKNLHIVGLGAIGNALIWALSFIKELSGVINLIDPEKIELSNLQRYMLTDQAAVNINKADLAEEYLERNGLTIGKFNMSLGEYISRNNPECILDLLAISVDNALDRVAAQALLPRIILNAWTGEVGQLGISHHWFSSPKACLACIYLTTEKVKSHTEKVSEFIGIELPRTNEIVVNQQPLTRELLHEIAEKKGYRLDDLLKWEGQPVSNLYHDAICGGIPLNLNNNSLREMDLVPLSHQSALAGVLLAVDLVKVSLGIITESDPVELRLSVLSPISDYILFQRGKTLHPKCICLDDDYQTVYREKYKNR